MNLERLLENFNKLRLITFLDLIVGPSFLNKKEKIFLLNERPISLAIK